MQEGTYTAFEEGTHLSYPWMAGRTPTRVDFSIREAKEGVRLHLRHDGWGEGMDEARQHHAQGWGFFLENLKSYLEEGVDRRTEALGLDVRR